MRRPVSPLHNSTGVVAALSAAPRAVPAAMATLLLCVGYYAGGLVGMALRFEPGQISGIWLPHGILVAALLAAPVRRWWLYTAALLPTHLHLVGTFQAPIPLVVMLIQFAGNIASACLAAALLRRVLGQPPRLDTLSRMGAFIAVAAVLAPFAISAVVAQLFLAVGWVADFWIAWQRRTLTGMCGAVIIGAPILHLAAGGAAAIRRISFRQAAEFAAVIAALVALVALSGWAFTDAHPQWLLFTPLPLLLWSAVRFGPGGLGLHLLAVALVAMLNTKAGRGPFATGATPNVVIELQLFFLAISVPLMLLAALVSQYAQAEQALRQSHAEQQQRTLQLRRLASQLTVTEQNAREQLARTLHDGLQQLLFMAGMTLDQALKAGSHVDQAGLLQRARADVKEAMEAARTLSVNLFPPVLQLGGLPAALEWLAGRAQDQYGVIVTVSADPKANPATSDARVVLFEAVRELLFNAVKHARVDRVDVHLALGPDDTIRIQISDEGVGFDPTVTLHPDNQHHVGLGLFSIQERLGLLGGHLDIQSAPGKGARFTLTLPRTELQVLQTDIVETRRHRAGRRERLADDSSRATTKSLRILIADDHPVARAGLRDLFDGRPPLQVVGEAANGVEAVSKAIELQPDIIVMDVSMPQMNGIEATREIHRALPHIQIVGLSTHDDDNTRRSMREAGAGAYFTKNEGTDRLLDFLLSLRAKAASGI